MDDNKKLFPLFEIEPRLLGCPACSIVTIPAELSQVLTCQRIEVLQGPMD